MLVARTAQRANMLSMLLLGGGGWRPPNLQCRLQLGHAPFMRVHAHHAQHAMMPCSPLPRSLAEGAPYRMSSVKSTLSSSGWLARRMWPRGLPVEGSLSDMAWYSSGSGTQCGGYLKRACKGRTSSLGAGWHGMATPHNYATPSQHSTAQHNAARRRANACRASTHVYIYVRHWVCRLPARTTSSMSTRSRPLW